MADNKSGRDKQADDADRRQRERDVVASLERMDETEPPVDETTLELFETELDSIPFPATGAEVVATVGDETIDSESGSYSVVDLVPDTDEEEFDSPAAVRMRVQRPTIAAAMKQIVEASEGSPHESLADSQREAYEKTFRKLRAIDAVDDAGRAIRRLQDAETDPDRVLEAEGVLRQPRLAEPTLDVPPVEFDRRHDEFGRSRAGTGSLEQPSFVADVKR